ncbi:MAG: helix-hairpin-helix domain-containing protein [Anaerolineales bacterium]|nr:helix-hairpin-helix domain-containing protein [Anaerolineales bacterium]
MKKYLDILIGALIGLASTGILWLVVGQPRGEPVTLEPPPTKIPLVVYVTGGVPRPGLYSLPEGSRIQDAIEAAGGFIAGADEDSINLAERIEDGQRLDIPVLEDIESDVGPAPTGEAPLELININLATLDELDNLPGIGPTTAQKIIDYREENGEFEKIDDIMEVAGIGPATFEDIKALITVE